MIMNAYQRIGKLLGTKILTPSHGDALYDMSMLVNRYDSELADFMQFIAMNLTVSTSQIWIDLDTGEHV